MPYITASIIMQVLGVVIPKLEKLQQEGAVGQRKITQYTRYLAIGICHAAGHGAHVHLRHRQRQRVLRRRPARPQNVPAAARRHVAARLPRHPTLVAGTALLMWMGEMISQRGIGNGMT